MLCGHSADVNPHRNANRPARSTQGTLRGASSSATSGSSTRTGGPGRRRIRSPRERPLAVAPTLGRRPPGVAPYHHHHSVTTKPNGSKSPFCRSSLAGTWIAKSVCWEEDGHGANTEISPEVDGYQPASGRRKPRADRGAPRALDVSSGPRRVTPGSLDRC